MPICYTISVLFMRCYCIVPVFPTLSMCSSYPNILRGCPHQGVGPCTSVGARTPVQWLGINCAIVSVKS